MRLNPSRIIEPRIAVFNGCSAIVAVYCAVFSTIFFAWTGQAFLGAVHAIVLLAVAANWFFVRLLTEEKGKDEALLQSIGYGVVALDARGVILFMNPAAAQIFGISAEKAVGKMFSQRVPLFNNRGKPVSAAERPIARALKGERVTVTATSPYFIERGSQRLPVAFTASPAILGGEMIGAILVFCDVSQEFAEDKAKGEFVSLASHQLRAPLSTINWYAEMLLYGDAGKMTKKQKKFLEEIYRGNQRMMNLINALVNVSRIELDTFQLELQPTDVQQLMAEAVADSAVEAKQKRLHIAESYADLPKVPLDPRLMRMVADNLLSNAVRYTPEGGTIVVSLKRLRDAFRLSVKDTGYGIPKAQQDRIFTKFFRADNVREKDTMGTGLGLYIVKSILDATGGRIWFESEEDKGTTFFVKLPTRGMKANGGAGEVKKLGL